MIFLYLDELHAIAIFVTNVSAISYDSPDIITAKQQPLSPPTSLMPAAGHSSEAIGTVKEKSFGARQKQV